MAEPAAWRRATRSRLFLAACGVLLALVAAGMARDDAYRIVQELAQRAFDEGVPLRELLARDERMEQISLDLDAIFSYEHYVRYAEEIVGRLDVVLAPADAAA